MNAVVALVGAGVCALGAAGVVRPGTLLGWVERAWRNPLGPSVAFAWRAALGVALLAGAATLRFPRAAAALGALSLTAAAGVPVLGRARMLRALRWWRARPAREVRFGSLLAFAFGAALLWSATPA